jgi:hypothetical protein
MLVRAYSLGQPNVSMLIFLYIYNVWLHVATKATGAYFKCVILEQNAIECFMMITERTPMCLLL